MNTRFVSIWFSAVVLILLSSQKAFSSVLINGSCHLSQLDAVSGKLLAKELEFLRLNTRLKLYSLPHGPWSARRQASIGFTNATLTATGALINGTGRLHFLGKRAPSPLFENAGIVRFMANCVSTGAAVYEFGNDCIVDWKERRNGSSLKIVHARAIQLKGEIEELINERNSLLESANYDGEKRRVLTKESEILSCLADSAASEFALYYARAKGNRTARRFGYLITITSNVASGAGTLVGIEANHLHGLSAVRRVHMGGVGGICDIITGSLNIASPVLTRSAAAVQRKLSQNELCTELGCKQNQSLLTLEEQLAKYENSSSDAASLELHGVVLRKEALKASAEILKKRNDMLASEHKAARARFIENMAVSSIAGGSKIANGIGGTIGAYKFTRDGYHRAEVQGGTAIAYGAGNILAALETARVRLGDEYKLFHKKGPSKEEILNQQLKRLESLQTTPQLAASPAQQTM